MGRFFTVRDDANAPAVVIVNQAFADAYWPGQSHVGKQIGVDYVGAGRNTDGAPRFSQGGRGCSKRETEGARPAG